MELQQRWDTHWFGASEHDEDGVRAELRRAVPPTGRTRLLVDGDRLVAAGWWWRPDDPTVLVDPDPGVDALAATRDLVSWLGRSGAVQVEVLWRDATLLAALEEQGWLHVRSQFELVRPAEDLPAPTWPDGVTISSLGDDPAEVHRLVYEGAGWGDVPGHTERDLEEWVDLFVTGEDAASAQRCSPRPSPAESPRGPPRSASVSRRPTPTRCGSTGASGSTSTASGGYSVPSHDIAARRPGTFPGR